MAWEPLKTHLITLLTIHWLLKAVPQRQIDRQSVRQIERGRASYPSWWRILRVATYSDPLVGDGGFDDEDVVDQVKLLPQGDLQHVHLHNASLHLHLSHCNERGEGARMKKNLESKKYHEHNLFSCSKKASSEGGGARAVWSAEQCSVTMRNVFKKWMWGVKNDTICWFFLDAFKTIWLTAWYFPDLDPLPWEGRGDTMSVMWDMGWDRSYLGQGGQ